MEELPQPVGSAGTPLQLGGHTLLGHQGFSEPSAASEARLKELYIPLDFLASFS